MRQITIPNDLKIAHSYEELFIALKSIIEREEILSLSIITGLTAKDLLANALYEDLKSYYKDKLKLSKHVIDFRRTPDMESCSKVLIDELAEHRNQWILGIGGGKVLDCAKYISHKIKAKLISIPTLISHDGICSPVAVIDGKSIGAIMPSAMLVPLYIIGNSSEEYIKAGIGDLLANLSAIEDWRLAHIHAQETIDDFAIMLSREASLSIVRSLPAIGTRDSEKADILKSPEFLSSLIESLALSGIAMSIAGNSRPCSGAEHMISHAIDQLYGHGSKAMHGIQVAVATLFLYPKRLELQTSSKQLKSNIYEDIPLEEILRNIGFPTTFRDINISEAEEIEILKLAPQTRKNRFTILDLGVF